MDPALPHRNPLPVLPYDRTDIPGTVIGQVPGSATPGTTALALGVICILLEAAILTVFYVKPQLFLYALFLWPLLATIALAYLLILPTAIFAISRGARSLALGLQKPQATIGILLNALTLAVWVGCLLIPMWRR